MKLREQYEKETGEKALYRRESSDYHTLRYVTWLETKLAAPAPKVETMLERAVTCYAEIDRNTLLIGTFCDKFLRAIGIDPDAPAPEKGE